MSPAAPSVCRPSTPTPSGPRATRRRTAMATHGTSTVPKAFVSRRGAEGQADEHGGPDAARSPRSTPAEEEGEDGGAQVEEPVVGDGGAVVQQLRNGEGKKEDAATATGSAAPRRRADAQARIGNGHRHEPR